MKRIIGVRFRERGFVYHFDCGPWSVKKGDYVLAESIEGLTIGMVVEGPVLLSKGSEELKIKVIDRPVTKEEIGKYTIDREFERRAWEYCVERIQAHGLSMKLVDVELLFDGSKIIFYFTADGRVDFRELLKDLVRYLRMRIELRQIGVRNHAAMVGGLGMCGRPPCCAQFLKKFHPVSIKMAKEQNLSLNPLKISGACGRLMCCLQYESDTYSRLKKGLPKVGKHIETEWGSGKVLRQNVLERTTTVELDEGQLVDVVYPLSEISYEEDDSRELFESEWLENIDEEK